MDKVTENDFNLLDDTDKKKLGELLIQIREKKNLTQSQAAIESKIQEDKIQEFECGESKATNAIQRILIMKYLKFLDSSDEKIINLLNEGYPNDIDIMTHTVNINEHMSDITFNDQIKKTKTIKNIKNKTKLVFSIGILIIFVIGLLVFTYKNIVSSVNEVSVNETTLIPKTTLNPTKIIDTVPEVSPINIIRNGQNYIISGSDKYVVKLSFDEENYIEIPNSDIIKTYQKGEEEIIESVNGDKILILTGNYQSLQITINDIELEIEPNLNGVVELSISFEGSEENE